MYISDKIFSIAHVNSLFQIVFCMLSFVSTISHQNKHKHLNKPWLGMLEYTKASPICYFALKLEI